MIITNLENTTWNIRVGIGFEQTKMMPLHYVSSVLALFALESVVQSLEFPLT